MSPALRHPDRDLAPPALGEQLLEGLGVLGHRRHQDLARDRVAVLAGVELEQELADQPAGVEVLHPVGDPAALAADAAGPDVEDLHRDLERVLGERDHVGVGAVTEDDGLLLQRLVERAEVVAQPGGLLVVLGRRRGVHLPLDALDERVGATAHEVGEVLGDPAVLVGVDPAHARGGALVDVAEQAGTADLAGPLEHPVAARAHREDAEQRVHGVADGPGVAVGAVVLDALLLRAATDHHPRELLVHGDREPRVGLVVAVLHVEPRVELLDPGVLQLQRLDLGRDDGPLHRGCGRHHRGGARVQVREVLEVRRQPRPQAHRLADVDDATVLVAEPVDAGLGRDRPGFRTVRRRVGHVSQPYEGPVSGSRRRARPCRPLRLRGDTRSEVRFGLRPDPTREQPRPCCVH